ncbi:MAG: serine/threonine-protein kinase [Planctomycetota bacterium]
MIAPTSQCLSVDELSRLLNGQLFGEELQNATTHIDECKVCQSITDSVARQQLSPIAASSVDRLADESACQAAVIHLLHSDAIADQPKPLVQQVGKYHLSTVIGRGGMGTVCLAEHPHLKRRCAIKLLRHEPTTKPGWLDRFHREMTTVASLQHPNIVQATDAGEDGSWHYLVMEYLEGLDVGRIASRLSRLSISDACEIVRQAAVGLEHIHEHGLAHRDIKPSNLMLTEDGVVKILDLGLVLPGDDPLYVDDRLTTVGHLLGTLAYMAPEQLLDCRRASPASDVYSLGATLFRLLTGRTAHRDKRGLAAQVLDVTQLPPPDPKALRAELPESLCGLLVEAMDLDPKSRPTAAILAESLEPHSRGARLQTLLRNAESASDREDPPPSTVAYEIEGLPRLPSNPPRAWTTSTLLIASLVAIVLCGGLFLELRTQSGKLIIESPSDNVTVVVRQNEQVVERLQIRSGDNELLLRQGTYDVRIEGVNGFELNQNRVVILGRQASMVAVEEKQSEAAFQKTANQDRAKELDAVGISKSEGPTVEQCLAMKPTDSQVEYDIPADVEELSVVSITMLPSVGWELRHSDGRIVRRFFDTLRDKKIDRWCYYLNGKEVYRDVDQNADGEVDQRVYIDQQAKRITWAELADDGSIKTSMQSGLPRIGELPPEFAHFNVRSARPTASRLKPDTTSKLYQGKDLAHWLGVLEREQESTSAVTAIRAVEILSRDSVQRETCLEESLSSADRFATVHSNSSFNESFQDVLPKYLPEPGLGVFERSLSAVNVKGFAATLHGLNAFFYGMNEFQTASLREQNLAELNRLVSTPDGFKQAERLLGQLGKKWNKLRPNLSANQKGLLESGVVTIGMEFASVLERHNGKDIYAASGEWIKGELHQRVDEGTAALDSHAELKSKLGLSPGGNNLAVHRLSLLPDELRLLVQWARADELELPPRLVIAVLAHAQHTYGSVYDPLVYEYVSEQSPTEWLQAIELRLRHADEQPMAPLMAMGQRQSSPIVQLVYSDFWKKTLSFWSHNTHDAQAAYQLLTRHRERLDDFVKVSPNAFASKSLEPIDNAIDTLRKRLSIQR